MTCPAVVRGRPQGCVSTARVVEIAASDVDGGRPGEAGVKVEDSADGPAAYDLLQPCVSASEDDRLPEAVDLQRLAYVVVRTSASELRSVWVRVLVVGG